MIVMAKPKKQSEPRGRARERGATTSFTFEMEPPLGAALEACARRDKRTKKAVLTIALEKYLGDEGLWPPAGEGGGR